jgi:hypothetical protein
MYEVHRLEDDLEPGAYVAVHRDRPEPVLVERVRVPGRGRLTRGLDRWRGMPPLDDPGWRLIGRGGPLVATERIEHALGYLLAIAPVAAAAIRRVAFEEPASDRAEASGDRSAAERATA